MVLQPLHHQIIFDLFHQFDKLKEKRDIEIKKKNELIDNQKMNKLKYFELQDKHKECLNKLIEI